jgi:hypothetical protein
MLDIDKLGEVGDEHVDLALRYYFSMKYNLANFRSDVLKGEIPVYSLKNCDEAMGTLLLISIDPKDDTIGYCLMDLGEELMNVMILDPKRVFTTWQEKEPICFFGKVGILRLDEDGIPNYHIRLISKEKPELREYKKYLTLWFSQYINQRASEELFPEMKGTYTPEPKDDPGNMEQSECNPNDDQSI